MRNNKMKVMHKYFLGIMMAAGLIYAAEDTAVKSSAASSSSVSVKSSGTAVYSGIAKVKKVPTPTKTNWSKIKDLFM
jgi:hypothetical protein